MLNTFIQQFVELLKTRQDNREKLFTNFVQPAYEAFEQAHQTYLETFQEYRNFIVSHETLSKQKMNELQERLINDSRFQQDLRSSAIQRAGILRTSRRYDFVPLISAIEGYFLEPIDGKSELLNLTREIVLHDNAARAFLYTILQLLQASLPDKKFRASITVEGIDEIIMYLQDRKSKIQSLYLDAKKNLMQM
jgi:hypothetical protein